MQDWLQKTWRMGLSEGESEKKQKQKGSLREYIWPAHPPPPMYTPCNVIALREHCVPRLGLSPRPHGRLTSPRLLRTEQKHLYKYSALCESMNECRRRVHIF